MYLGVWRTASNNMHCTYVYSYGTHRYCMQICMCTCRQTDMLHSCCSPSCSQCRSMLRLSAIKQTTQSSHKLCSCLSCWHRLAFCLAGSPVHVHVHASPCPCARKSMSMSMQVHSHVCQTIKLKNIVYNSTLTAVELPLCYPINVFSCTTLNC